MERFTIGCESDIAIAVVGVQAYARDQGFPQQAIARITTAVSELGRNIVKYCPGTVGDVLVEAATDVGGALTVQVRDNGAGMEDLELALQDHYSSSGTLGLGLPGVRRIVDHFSIVSVPGEGTVVTIAVER